MKCTNVLHSGLVGLCVSVLLPGPVVRAQEVVRGAAGGAAVGAIGGAIGGDAGKGAAIGAASGGLIGGMRKMRTQPIFEFLHSNGFHGFKK